MRVHFKINTFQVVGLGEACLCAVGSAMAESPPQHTRQLPKGIPAPRHSMRALGDCSSKFLLLESSTFFETASKYGHVFQLMSLCERRAQNHPNGAQISHMTLQTPRSLQSSGIPNTKP